MERIGPGELAELRAWLLRAADNREPRFVRIDANSTGRDFITGDVHGAYDLVWRAMKAAGFDRTADRLFGVGDLLDRGAGSARAAAFLGQAYVRSIKGNHEDDLVALYRDHEDPEEGLEVLVGMNFNGMAWIGSTTPAARIGLVKRLATLPLAMEVATVRGAVGIVHGEVPIGMDWQTFIDRIERGDKDTIESCLRGRKRINGRNLDGVRGVGRIFAGHTPQFTGAARFGNTYALDTGAVFSEISNRAGAAITFADMTFRTASLSSPNVTGPVHLFDQETDEPFGHYVAPKS